VLRAEAGRDPYDRELSDLVGELSTKSEAFRARWATHNVRFHDTGTKHFHHPVVGDLSLRFERLELSADSGLTIFAYAAEPGSQSEEALNPLRKLGRHGRARTDDLRDGPSLTSDLGAVPGAVASDACAFMHLSSGSCDPPRRGRRTLPRRERDAFAGDSRRRTAPTGRSTLARNEAAPRISPSATTGATTPRCGLRGDSCGL
jgi:MmyB-like transcription regulator ligand binding domain